MVAQYIAAGHFAEDFPRNQLKSTDYLRVCGAEPDKHGFPEMARSPARALSVEILGHERPIYRGVNQDHASQTSCLLNRREDRLSMKFRYRGRHLPA